MSNDTFKNKAEYWDRKLVAFLHDPPDKALHISGNEKGSADTLLKVFGLSAISLDDNLVGRADVIASGMDRAQLPGYSANPNENGLVAFAEKDGAFLTHPTGEGHPIRLTFPDGIPDARTAHQTVAEVVRADSALVAKQCQGSPDAFAAARFHYAVLALRERLVEENAAGLGGLWRKLPADTRTPDHSIWHHCGLVSALSACFDLSPTKQASVMVMSVTPVQDFIGRARKLRDYWTGSVLLSWLAFEGVRAVAHELGADHILYPSLAGQPLALWLLEQECGCKGMAGIDSHTAASDGIASFPNKFVCLVPAGREKETAAKIIEAMREAWRNLAGMVLDFVEGKANTKDPEPRNQFARQIDTFFSFQWAASPLMDAGKEKGFDQLLPESVWKEPLSFDRESRKISPDGSGAGTLYPVTHALAQSLLAANKGYRTDDRKAEPGIKCQLHPDLEALRFAWTDENPDRNPRPENDQFWNALRENLGNRTEITNKERLSSVALVKRLAFRAIKEKGRDHPLSLFFNRAVAFPSTTEMALTDWLKKVEKEGLANGLGANWRRDLAQLVHEADEDADRGETISELPEERRKACRKVIAVMQDKKLPITDSDKYYAILLMDGDHMGKLVNGETVAATWRSVLHPELVRRLESPTFSMPHRDFWGKHLDHHRVLAPAVHTAISEALGDFALFVVPKVIEKHQGRLIYAGGDDVCAVLPASSAIPAARELAAAYGWGFVADGAAECRENWRVGTDRLGIHLGAGDDISISAGILVVHHKRPLAASIRRAHQLLDRAKKEGGRNAFAIELAKRSGGSRYFVAKWDKKPLAKLAIPKYLGGDRPLLDHFLGLGRLMDASAAATVSSSFLYRVGELKAGVEPILARRAEGLVPFIMAAMRKKLDDPEWLPIAASIAALVGREDEAGKPRVEAEPLVMARFFGAIAARQAKPGRILS